MLRLEIPADLKSTDAAAAEIRRLAERLLPPEKATCVEIAVSEALSNIVRHAFNGTSDQTIVLLARPGAEGLGITLTDCGAPLPPRLLENVPPPDDADGELAEDGRGLSLIYQCSDEVQFRHAAGVNYLLLRFRGEKG